MEVLQLRSQLRGEKERNCQLERQIHNERIMGADRVFLQDTKIWELQRRIEEDHRRKPAWHQRRPKQSLSTTTLLLDKRPLQGTPPVKSGSPVFKQWTLTPRRCQMVQLQNTKSVSPLVLELLRSSFLEGFVQNHSPPAGPWVIPAETPH